MPEKIDLQEFAEHSEWKRPLKVSFSEHASLSIAQWILWIFAGVLSLSFIILVILMFRADTPLFEKVTDLLKFLVQSVVPLVTLAVGYYLGDRGRQDMPRE